MCLMIILAVRPQLIVPAFGIDARMLDEDYNPFDEIRACEERCFINGTVLHVEYIDWESCKLFLYEQSWPYVFDADAFGTLKKHEGEKVTILCYVQCYDGLYRLYACNDWPMGYVKVVSN